jgi:hypothetical protein
MINKEVAKKATLHALGWARSVRVAVEKRDRIYRAAPSRSTDDVLSRLRANAAVRAAMRGDK